MQQTFGADSISLVQGSSRAIKILLRHRDGEAFDLDGATEITARFKSKPVTTIKKSDGEITVLTPTARGALVLNIPAAKSLKLDTGDRMSFDIEVTKNSKLYIIQFLEVLDIEKPIS